MNGTISLTLGEDIKESGFTGTTGTHQSSEHAGLDPALDIVQQSAITRRSLDDVAEVLPGEDGRVADEAIIIGALVIGKGSATTALSLLL